MSFQKNDIWMPNGSDSLANSEMSYEPSTGTNQKRGPQLFMDASKQELFSNKKPAVESVNPTSGAAILNDPLRRDISGNQPGGQIGDRLFLPKPVRISDVSNKNLPFIVSSDLNIQNGYGDQHGNDSAILLSMSRSLEDPLCLKTGVKRVKVKEIRISENLSPVFSETSFCPREKNKARSDNGMPSERTYGTSYGSPFIMDPACSRPENYIFSLRRQASSNGYTLANQHYNWVNNSVSCTGQGFDRRNYYINSMMDWYQKENGNFRSLCPTDNNFHGNFFAIYPFFNGSKEALFAGSSNNKVDTTMTAMTLYHGHPEAAVTSQRTIFLNKIFSPIPSSDNYKNGEQIIVPFQSNAGASVSAGGLISACAVSPFQSSGMLGGKDSVGHRGLNVISAATSKTEGAQKNKEQKTTKRTPSNNFPANVKSLLLTGILNGVPVKYVSWSRETTLRGVVNGIGYLCGCQECKLNKVVNAYEFESHAGCKTKHPNNHIYFENGKTIYAAAQELKNTPREMLFDAMQNVTGSPINKKNFDTWKASYKAASQELQWDCLKAEAIMPS